MVTLFIVNFKFKLKFSKRQGLEEEISTGASKRQGCDLNRLPALCVPL